jgi:hypothetical protein
MQSTLTLAILSLWSVTAYSQSMPDKCGQLHNELDSFLKNHNPYRSDVPKGTFEVVRAELGQPSRLEPSPTGTTAVYIRDGCLGGSERESDG